MTNIIYKTSSAHPIHACVTTVVSTHYIDMETLSYAKGDRYEDWDGTTLNTDTSVTPSSQHDIICSIHPIT